MSGQDFYDEKFFRLLVNKYRDRVIRFVSLFVNDRLSCEELASDVFMSLWNKRNHLHDILDMDSYIFIIAKNKALNHVRNEFERHLTIDSLDTDAFFYTETTPESLFLSKELAAELNAVVNALPDRTRLAFHLVREQKKSYKEAAEIMGISVKTIEKQVAHAVNELKKHLLKK
jgi:RNA polymerase sigma-70 factor (ECF subfamily)